MVVVDTPVGLLVSPVVAGFITERS